MSRLPPVDPTPLNVRVAAASSDSPFNTADLPKVTVPLNESSGLYAASARTASMSVGAPLATPVASGNVFIQAGAFCRYC